MDCPFCKSEMHAEASVCPTCRRDIYLLKPLLARIKELETEVARLDKDLATAQTSVSDDKTEKVELAQASVSSVKEISFTSRFLAAAQLFFLPVFLLLLTHWLLVFVYDVRVFVLRIVVLLIPLPFGFLLARRAGLSLGTGLPLALLMAAITVVGMSIITAHFDKVPVWPQSFIEWREFFEFSLSIAFSTITGLWLGRIVRHVATHTDSSHWMMTAARHLCMHSSSPEAIKAIAGRLEKVVNTLITLVTTAISIYTGFKGLFS